MGEDRMLKKLPIGIQTFSNIINDNYLKRKNLHLFGVISKINKGIL